MWQAHQSEPTPIQACLRVPQRLGKNFVSQLSNSKSENKAVE
jgi:hypothetical protein